MLKFKFVREGAKPPSVGHAGDLGFDLYAAEDTMIKPGESVLVPTGLAVEMLDHDGTPLGFILKDRSSMAAKGLETSAGVIDAGYRGEILVRMAYRPSSVEGSKAVPYTIQRGDKVAQAIPVRPNTAHIMHKVDSFEETSRGEKGFGSTGSK